MQYRGFTIDLLSLGEDGYSCSVYRTSDGWVLWDEWDEDRKDAIVSCKAVIDDYYVHPELYEDIE